MKISKEDYLKAQKLVDNYHKQELEKNKSKIKKCEHNWILDEGWNGRLDGDKYCSICGTPNPNNYN